MNYPPSFKPWIEAEWDRICREGYSELLNSPSAGARRTARLLMSSNQTDQAGFIRLFVARACREPTTSNLDEFERRLADWRAKVPLEEIHGAAIDRNRLAKALRTELTPIVGELINDRPLSPRVRAHSRRVDDLVVETLIDVGGGTQLKYHHQVLKDGNQARPGRLPGVPVIEGTVHWQGWLGLSSQTDFTLIEQGKELAAVAFVGELCNRFFSALPRLLAK